MGRTRRTVAGAPAFRGARLSGGLLQDGGAGGDNESHPGDLQDGEALPEDDGGPARRWRARWRTMAGSMANSTAAMLADRRRPTPRTRACRARRLPNRATTASTVSVPPWVAATAWERVSGEVMTAATPRATDRLSSGRSWRPGERGSAAISRRSSRRRAQCKRTENTGAEHPSARGGVGDRQCSPGRPPPLVHERRLEELLATRGSVMAQQYVSRPRRTATATARRVTHRTSAKLGDTSQPRSRPPPRHRPGARRRRESRHTGRYRTSRSAYGDPRSAGSHRLSAPALNLSSASGPALRTSCSIAGDRLTNQP